MFISIADFLALWITILIKRVLTKRMAEPLVHNANKAIYWRDKVVGVPYYNGTRCLGYRKASLRIQMNRRLLRQGTDMI